VVEVPADSLGGDDALERAIQESLKTAPPSITIEHDATASKPPSDVGFKGTSLTGLPKKSPLVSPGASAQTTPRLPHRADETVANKSPGSAPETVLMHNNSSATVAVPSNPPPASPPLPPAVEVPRGGFQCSHCTFVNEKTANGKRLCSVCELETLY